MRLPLRIALRYIFSRRSFHFITVITFISIVGITVGVAALITVISIFNGFGDLTEKQIVGFDPHIRITSENENPEETFEKLLPEIQKIEEVKAASTAIRGRVVATKGSNVNVFNLIALPPERSDYYSILARNVTIGEFDLTGGNLPGIVLGIALADKLNVLPKDTLILMSPKMVETSLRTYRKKAGMKCVVTGIFRTNFEADQIYGFVSESVGRQLFSPIPKTSYTMALRLESLEKAGKVEKSIKKLLPAGFNIVTWKDLNEELFNVMEFERMAAFVILSLIIIIAAFNVLASLSMTVVEKRRDIAALKSFGATDRLIRNTFLTEGLIIGVISTTLGTAIGLFLCFGQIEYGWFALDGQQYIVNAIPVLVNATDVAIIAVFSLLLSFLATIYPAKRASDVVIAESIRDE